jgi:multidrug efflux pump
VLIIEFAKDLQAQGKSPDRGGDRRRPPALPSDLMTSLAFILGVLPLVIAGGAGSASQRAIGTGVMGGMITATALGVFFVPVFFVVVRGCSRAASASARSTRMKKTPHGSQEKI